MIIKKLIFQNETIYKIESQTSVEYIKDVVKLKDYDGIIPRLDYYTWDDLHNCIKKESTRFYPVVWVGEERNRCSPYLIIYKFSDDLKDWKTKISDVRIDYYYNLGDEERWGEGIRTIYINGKWGAVIGKTGYVIVPFGKYDFVDGFKYGLSRVRKGGYYYIYEADRYKNQKEKWGIINTWDEIVLPIEYDEVYSFYDKSFKSVFIVKDGVKKEFPLWMSANDFSKPYYCDYDNELDREINYLRERVSGYRKPELLKHYRRKENNYLYEFIGINDAMDDDL